MKLIKCYGEKLILNELKKSYNFFINEANKNKKSFGYGLIRDKTILSNDIASIASVGYGLGALIIGLKHKWISYKKAYDRANGTLDTFLNYVDGKNGFYYHFINMNTGKREWNCEISIIDTAIFICGAIAVGEYFGGSIKQNKKEIKDYNNIKNIIYTYCGTLFTYQFSHAWIDFRNLKDKNNIDWFENSIRATKANMQYCIDNKYQFRTYDKNSWGLTACLTPKGYANCGGNMALKMDII